MGGCCGVLGCAGQPVVPHKICHAWAGWGQLEHGRTLARGCWRRRAAFGWRCVPGAVVPAGDPGSALHARGPHGIPDKAVLSATRERWDSAREGGSPKAIPLPAAQPSPPAPNPALGETSGSGSRRRLLRGHRRKGPRASLPPHPWGTAQRRRRGSRIHPRCAAQLTRNPSPPSAAPRPRVPPSPPVGFSPFARSLGAGAAGRREGSSCSRKGCRALRRRPSRHAARPSPHGPADRRGEAGALHQSQAQAQPPAQAAAQQAHRKQRRRAPGGGGGCSPGFVIVMIIFSHRADGGTGDASALLPCA